MPRGTPTVWDDRAVIRAVRRIRTKHGSCTYRQLAAELGVAIRPLHVRCQLLIAEGKLVAGPGVGSLRPPPRRR